MLYDYKQIEARHRWLAKSKKLLDDKDSAENDDGRDYAEHARQIVNIYQYDTHNDDTHKEIIPTFCALLINFLGKGQNDSPEVGRRMAIIASSLTSTLLSVCQSPDREAVATCNARIAWQLYENGFYENAYELFSHTLGRFFDPKDPGYYFNRDIRLLNLPKKDMTIDNDELRERLADQSLKVSYAAGRTVMDLNEAGDYGSLSKVLDRNFPHIALNAAKLFCLYSADREHRYEDARNHIPAWFKAGFVRKASPVTLRHSEAYTELSCPDKARILYHRGKSAVKWLFRPRI